MMSLLSKRILLGLLVALLAFSGLLVSARPVQAASITVTTDQDEYGAGTGCSLREAITAANTDKAFGGCPAGSGADQIYLPALPNAHTQGTYYRIDRLNTTTKNEDNNATGDLDITSSITIVGAGGIDPKAGTAFSTVRRPASVILSDRIFHVIQPNVSDLNTPRIVVTFSSLSIQYGQTATGDAQGGAIYNQGGKVSLIGTLISNNTSDNGGGLASYHYGSMTISNSTISNNIAIVGGGLYSLGNVTIDSSLILSNSATNSGGGLDARPGGIPDFEEKTVILNSTITSNYSQQGAGIANSGIMELRHATIVRNNGVGVLNMGGNETELRTANSIIAANIPLTSSETNCMVEHNSGDPVVTSQGENVVTENNSSAQIIVEMMVRTQCDFNHPTDQLGVTNTALNLAADLSYVNFTGAYQFGASNVSVAIDSIPSNNPYCQHVDQFFHIRPWKVKTLACDAGAYEQGSVGRYLFLPNIKR